jgi:uncharacterized protein (TIGR02594 family)
MLEQPRWLAEAWREFGQGEIPGSRHNPRITAFFKELGHEKYARDEVAWCAAFVGACLERAGLSSTRSLMARSYSSFGTKIDTERFGALAVLSRGSDPAFGHVGFVVGWTGQKLWLLGGNQANQVSVAAYPRRRLVALRWPAQPAGLQDIRATQSTSSVFQIALQQVLHSEGGYGDDPYDPGGPTNKGITLRTLAAWRSVKLDGGNRSQLIEALKRISDDDVTAIYRKRYWQPAGCPRLPGPLAIFHFDAAVNHGVTGATRMLQQAVGSEPDGEIGPKTIRKIKGLTVLTILSRYAAIRRKRYRSLPHFWRFGRGWLKRVDRVLEIANRQAAAIGGQEKTHHTSKGDRKMNTTQAPQPSKWWGDSMTIWGAFITAAAVVLPTLGPLIGLEINAAMVRELGEHFVTLAQAVVALFGTAVTIYGRARADQPLSRRSLTLKL